MEEIIAIIDKNDKLKNMPLLETATILFELREKGLLNIPCGHI